MYDWHAALPGELYAVEYHPPLVVELRELVAVEEQPVLAVADDAHIGFENLCGVVLSEHEVDVVVEAVAFGEFYEVELLLEGAEHYHARRTPFLFRLSDEHLRAEVHELGGSEVLVGVEELGARLFALAVAAVAADVPRGVGAVGVVADVVGYVGYDELRLGQGAGLEILEVVSEELYGFHVTTICLLVCIVSVLCTL